ncbi:MAG: hypothetical protein FWG45_05750 [Oscillospiraceae bacterium]|nr:hypothetical protein [Oscillospiraceae bacterium]
MNTRSKIERNIDSINEANLEDETFIKKEIIPALNSAQYTCSKGANNDRSQLFLKLCNEALKIYSPTSNGNYENVSKYREFLRYREKASFFEKGGFTGKWGNISIAERTIRRLMKDGNYDYSTACKIYSFRTTVKYAPLSNEIVVACNKCGQMHFFEKINISEKCENAQCKSPLFVLCANCGKPNSAHVMYCVDCSRNLKISSEYDGYAKIAKEAIQLKNIPVAESAYYNAVTANSAKSNELSWVYTQIQAEKKNYDSTISELKGLVDKRKFFEARVKLQSIKSKFSWVKVAELPFYDIINSEIATAEKALEIIKKLPDSDTEGRKTKLTSLFNSCADYQQAKDEFAKIPLNKPQSISPLDIDYTQNTISIKWDSARNEPNAKYTVVRKADSAPVSVDDSNGVLIAKEISVLSCVDSNPEPGRVVYYAVFTTTNGRSSQPIVANIRFLQNIKNFSYKSTENGVEAKFTVPSNSTKVEIYRKDSNGRQIEIHHTSGFFVCNDIKAGEEHTFKFVVFYPVPKRKHSFFVFNTFFLIFI